MFTHQQQITGAGVVSSVQSLRLMVAGFTPTPATVAAAGRLYWVHLRRLGLGLLRIQVGPDGEVAVGLLGLTLLSFDPPSIVEDGRGYAARYAIQAGVAVGRHGRGEGYLQICVGEERVLLAVDGYHAAIVGARRNPLRLAFYLATQSLLHLVVARTFLGYLRRRLTP